MGLRYKVVKKGGDFMKQYTVTIYLSIDAESEKEAREIAFGLDIVPKKKEDEYKINWNSQNTEVEEEPF
jgi:hypothetical protein